MGIKLIVTDLDGTFLDTYHTLNEENVKAVRRAREQGIYVAAVTARNWSACKWAVTETGFDPLCVINNGAAIVATRSWHLKIPFPHRLCAPFYKRRPRPKPPLMYLPACFPWNMSPPAYLPKIWCNGAQNGRKNQRIAVLWWRYIKAWKR